MTYSNVMVMGKGGWVMIFFVAVKILALVGACVSTLAAQVFFLIASKTSVIIVYWHTDPVT